MYEEVALDSTLATSMILGIPTDDSNRATSQDVEMQSLTSQQPQQLTVVEKESTPVLQESLQDLHQLLDEHGQAETQINQQQYENINLHDKFDAQSKMKVIEGGETQVFSPSENFSNASPATQSVDTTQFPNGNAGIFNQTCGEQPTSTVFEMSEPQKQDQNNMAAFGGQESNGNHFSSPQHQITTEQKYHPYTSPAMSSPGSVLSQNTTDFEQVQIQPVSVDSLWHNDGEMKRQNSSDHLQQLNSPPAKKTFTYPAEDNENQEVISSSSEPNLVNNQYSGLPDDLRKLEQQIPFTSPSTLNEQHSLSDGSSISQAAVATGIVKSTDIVVIPNEINSSINVLNTENNGTHSVPATSTQNFMSNDFIKDSALNQPTTNSNQNQHFLEQFVNTMTSTTDFKLSETPVTVSKSGGQIHPECSTTNTEQIQGLVATTLQNIVTERNSPKNQESAASSSQNNNLQDLHKTMQELVSLLKMHNVPSTKVESEVIEEPNSDVQKKREMLMKSLQEQAVLNLPVLAQQVRMSTSEGQSNPAQYLPLQAQHSLHIPNNGSNSASVGASEVQPPAANISQINPQNSGSSQAEQSHSPSINGQTEYKLLPCSTVPSTLPAQTLQAGGNKVQVINDAMYHLLLDQTRGSAATADVASLLQNKLLNPQQRLTQQGTAKPHLVSSTSQPPMIVRVNPQLVSQLQNEAMNQQSQQSAQVVSQGPAAVHTVNNQQEQLPAVLNQQAPSQISTSQQSTGLKPITILPLNAVGQVSGQNQQPMTLISLPKQQGQLKLIPGAKVLTLTNGRFVKGQQSPVAVVTGNTTFICFVCIFHDVYLVFF